MRYLEDPIPVFVDISRVLPGNTTFARDDNLPTAGARHGSLAIRMSLRCRGRCGPFCTATGCTPPGCIAVARKAVTTTIGCHGCG